MDALYDSQIKNYNHPTAQQKATFRCPASQMGAGLRAFAMRMGRMAFPVVRKYILPVAKHLGKNFWRPLFLKMARFWPDKRDQIAKC